MLSLGRRLAFMLALTAAAVATFAVSATPSVGRGFAAAAASPSTVLTSDSDAMPGLGFGRYADRGLGDYGPSGPITAENAIPGTPAAAIAIAQRPEFASVRTDWDESLDFVLQVMDETKFREMEGFNASPAAVANAVANRAEVPDEFFAEWGVFLNAQQRAEVLRRNRLAGKSAEMKELFAGSPGGDESNVVHPKRWAGAMLDHLDGGRLKVAIVNPTAAEKAAIESHTPRGADDVEIISAKYSLNELRHYQDVIGDQIDIALADFVAAGGEISGSPAGTSIEVEENRILVEITGAVGVDLSMIPDDAYKLQVKEMASVVTAGEWVNNSYYSKSQSYQQPGLRMSVRDDDDYSNVAYCTWGFNGHTSSYLYMITAGHCVHDIPGGAYSSGTSGWVESFQPGTSNIRLTDPNSSYGDPYAGYAVWRGWGHDSTKTDSARIEVGDYADSNCYWSTSDCAKTITKRQSLNRQDDAVGDYVGFSASAENKYKTGYVTKYGDKWINIGLFGFVHIEEMEWVGATVIGGDSGGGVVSGSMAIGIVDALDNERNEMMFSHIYNSKTELGYEPNCVRNSSTATGWGDCPVYDAPY